MANNGDNPEPKQPPRHARILGYALEPAEKLLLLAIDEHCDGNTLTASKERLAAYTGLSMKQVRRLFNGHLPVDDGKGTQEQREKRTEAARKAWREGRRTGDAGKYKPGFIDRRILIQRGEGGWKRGMNVTSTYQINEEALKECPKVKEYRERDKQRVLPGFREPAAPGHPVYLEKPVISPGDRRVTMTVPGRVTMTPHPPSQPEMRPMLEAPDGHHDRGRVTMTLHTQPQNTVLDPGMQGHHDRGRVTMTHDPSSGLDLISLKDSSVSKESIRTTTSSDVPDELKNGLREILPALDDRAIKQLWMGCKDNAPDCTVEEVLHFAWTKVPALRRNSTQNPAGLLITSVPLCFEGGERSALAQFRLEQIREQERHADQLQRQAADERDNQEWLREMQEIEREVETLDSLPTEEFQALHAEAEKADWVADFRRKAPSAEVEKTLRRQMAKIRLAGNNQNDKPPP